MLYVNDSCSPNVCVRVGCRHVKKKAISICIGDSLQSITFGLTLLNAVLAMELRAFT